MYLCELCGASTPESCVCNEHSHLIYERGLAAGRREEAQRAFIAARNRNAELIPGSPSQEVARA